MNTYVELAKKAIETYVRKYQTLEIPDGLPPEFYTRRAGVFVTIYNGNDLRGCIGTFKPTQENIAIEIIRNAISACSQDWRFHSINADELDDLRYEVSILSAPQKVIDISKHNPKHHGIIVRTFDGRAGLLLPNLEGIKETGQQISIAASKGGIDPESDKIELLEFEVEKHE